MNERQLLLLAGFFFGVGAGHSLAQLGFGYHASVGFVITLTAVALMLNWLLAYRDQAQRRMSEKEEKGMSA